MSSTFQALACIFVLYQNKLKQSTANKLKTHLLSSTKISTCMYSSFRKHSFRTARKNSSCIRWQSLVGISNIFFSKFTGGTSRQRPKPKQLLNYMAGEPVPALAIGSNSFKSFQIVWYRIGRNWKELEAIASFRSRFAGTRKKKRYWNPI